ncbi:MAG: hypothetical protein ABI680_18640 [Chthoniobacteraceae bacterium]
MISDWTDTATRDNLGVGVAADDFEAPRSATISAIPALKDVPEVFDRTGDVEAWRADDADRG